MYLKGSNWSMQRKRKRSNPVRVFFLALAVAGVIYVNQVIVPQTPPLFIDTPTPTRAPESYLTEAQALVQDGKVNQAIAMYQEAAKADPRNPSIYVTLARWQVLYGDLDGALENAENALLLNPSHALARAVKGWVLAEQKEFQLAAVELEEALELDPNSALAYAYQAEMYIDMIADGKGDINTQDRAIEASRRARDLDPNLLEVRRVRGLVLEFTNQSEEAIQEFEAAIALNENLADLYIALGRNYRYTGQTDRAVDALMKAISLRPEDAEPYSELAATYLNIGEFSKGTQIAEQAVERDPSSAFLHGLLGTMHYRQAQYNEAIPYLRLAVKGGLTKDGVQVEPLPLDAYDLPSIFYRLRYGIALSEVGQCAEAVQVGQNLLEALPDDVNVQENTAIMFETCKEQVDNPLPAETEEPEATGNPEQ